jgi:hypothetical protein
MSIGGTIGRRSRRRSGVALALSVAAAVAVAAAAAVFVATMLWPRWPAPKAAVDVPALPITVGATLFNVPPAAIRVAVQRHAGAHERLDLAFHWPSLAPPDPSVRPAPSEDLAPLDRVFVTIMLESGGVPPAERLKAIYPRYLADKRYAGSDGLATIAFRDGTPYQGEDVYFDGAAPAHFLVRCTRPTASDLPGICLAERRIGTADVTVRFPRDWLSEWRKVAEGIERLVAAMRPAGA